MGLQFYSFYLQTYSLVTVSRRLTLERFQFVKISFENPGSGRETNRALRPI